VGFSQSPTTNIVEVQVTSVNPGHNAQVCYFNNVWLMFLVFKKKLFFSNNRFVILGATQDLNLIRFKCKRNEYFYYNKVQLVLKVPKTKGHHNFMLKKSPLQL